MAMVDDLPRVMVGGMSLPNLPRDSVGEFNGEYPPAEVEMLWFWTGWADWLATRGFVVNIGTGPSDTTGRLVRGWTTPKRSTSAAFPYAVCERRVRSSSPWTRPPPLRIAWAQDHHQRDIVLKLISTGSDEHCIYQQLLSSSQLFRIDTFSGVLPPVAIFDSTLGFSFVAMPRWGSTGRLEHMRSAYEVIQFMRHTVNGLKHLHDMRVVHRDIDTNNMLVNCYNPLAVSLGDDNEDILSTHRRADSVRYCLFDFNVSLRLPEDTSLSACRRPSCESSIGSPLFQPPDINFGEYEYNPFAYDVACLGNVYRIYFSPMVPDVPLLAPLFDRMTTHIVSERFTAAEAADFLGSIAHQISDSGVDAQLALTTDWECRGTPGIYWSRTTPEFRAQWAHLRTPELSWPMQVIDWVADHPVGWQVLCYIRRTARF